MRQEIQSSSKIHSGGSTSIKILQVIRKKINSSFRGELKRNCQIKTWNAQMIAGIDTAADVDLKKLSRTPKK